MDPVTTQPTDLASYVSSQQVVAVPVASEPVSEEANEAPDNIDANTQPDAGTEGAPTEQVQQPVGQEATQGQGVTTPAPAEQDPRSAELVAREQAVAAREVAQRQALLHGIHTRIQAEARQFEESLEEMSESERQAAINDRRAAQLANQNRYLSGQLTSIQRAQYQRENESAKGQVAFIMAQQHGIPFEGEYREALLTAHTADDMKRLAATFSNVIRRAKVDRAIGEVAQQIESGAWVAGGAGQSSPTPTKTKVGSGDLASYISEKGGYQIVPHMSS